MQRSAHTLLVLCVLAASACATGPAFAKQSHGLSAQPATIAELQPGDRSLSCSVLTGQISRMNDIARTGRLDSAEPKGKGLIGSVKRVGTNLVRGKAVSTVVSLTGPVGSLVTKVVDGRDSDRKDALKDSARLRHDRLITLYDRKGCA